MSQINFGKNDGKNIMNTELTGNERRILLELINNPSIPYDTLVVDLGISRRTVSRVFSSFEEKGFIERVGTNKKDIGKSSNKISFVRFLQPPPKQIGHEPAADIYNTNGFLGLNLEWRSEHSFLCLKGKTRYPSSNTRIIRKHIITVRITVNSCYIPSKRTR